MKRCLVPLVALVSTLFLALPAAVGAANTHQHRGTVHVRHQTIHRPPQKGHKHGRKRHTARKHPRHAQKHKRHRHKRHTRKRHKHKRVVRHTRRRRPATASGYCPNANLTPKGDNIERVVTATLCLVNDERARFGEPGLIEDSRLSGAAAAHSHDMDARHYFEHVSPGGQTLLMRIRASGFILNANVGYTLGENLAWGTLWLGTPHAIVNAWMASPGHRANILNRSYRYTGIGIDPALPRSMSDGQAGGMYTQDFGTITG